MKVSDHANAYRMLSKASGAPEPGKYHSSRAPYQREMMDAILEPGIEEVTFMTCARGGKTTVMENILGYFIHYDPSPILIVEETDKKAKSFSKINFQPMINDNEYLSNRFASERSRNADSEILFKSFLGGYIVIGGANTPTTFSAYSMRIVVFEDVDRFPPTVGTEGDPIDLGKQRAENFLNRKFIYNSTPTIKDASRIEQSWNESDQRLYFVPCPFCNHKQILVFGARSQFAHLTNGFLKYEAEGKKVKSVAYVCSECKKEIPERYKNWMVKNGEWRKMRPEVKHHAGFQLNRLYSPWSEWKRIVELFLKAEKRPERLQPWINTTLGETFVENLNYEFNENILMSRREPYENIPMGVIALTVGVDIQENRVEMVIYGFGLHEECWYIDSAIIPGSIEDDLTHKAMDAFVLQERYFENGFPSRFGNVGGILCVAIDGRDQTKAVKIYAAKRKKRFVVVMGANKPQKDFVQFSRAKKQRNVLVLVDTHQGKKMIYHRLHNEIEKDGPTPQGMHFNMHCDAEFFEQLTSERLMTRKRRGYTYLEWVLPAGKQNHKLDCTNYAFAGLHLATPGGSKNVEPFLKRLSDVLSFRMQQWEKKNESSIPPGSAAVVQSTGKQNIQSMAPAIFSKKKKLRMKLRMRPRG